MTLISKNELKPDYNIDCKGIYFLYYNELCVYVGLSNSSVINRIFGNGRDNGHISNKIFNRYDVLNMDNYTEKEIDEKETELIQKYLPYYNIAKIHKNQERKVNDEFIDIMKKQAYSNAMIMASFF